MKTIIAGLSTLVLAATTVTSSLIGHTKRQDASSTGYDQPQSWLTIVPGSNLGEPINVVISNASSTSVLSDPAPYFSSLFYSPNSCLGFNLGGEQQANLDDGQGVVNQTDLYRYNFANGITTCQQSLNGGMHFRLWSQATSGALFLAVSQEESAAQNHIISTNGYNLGRNWFVGNATNSSGTTSPQDDSRYTTSMASYAADIDPADLNHGIQFDGNIFVLTVTQTAQGNGVDVTDADAVAAAASASATGGGGSSSSSSGARRVQTANAPWVVVAGSLVGTLVVGSLVGGLSLVTLGP